MLNGRPVFFAYPTGLGSNYFFPHFPMSTSRRYDPAPPPLRPISIHPLLRRSPRSRFHHLGSSFQLFLAVVWLTFRRRNGKKTRAQAEGRIKRRGEPPIRGGKGASRKVVKTRRRPPSRGGPQRWRVPTCERAHSLFRLPARYRLSLLWKLDL